MSTVTRSQFDHRFESGIDLEDPALREGLEKSGVSLADLAKADLDGDGVIRGEKELSAAFKFIDGFDKNGSAQSFDDSGKAGALQTALMEGRLEPSGARADFQRAAKEDPALAGRLLNGMSMGDLLESLDGLPKEQRQAIFAAAKAEGLNTDRLEYAAQVVDTGHLPAMTPGDLAGTGQVNDAVQFLRSRGDGSIRELNPELFRVIQALISASEGQVDSIQNKDSGIVSFGKYQFTLKHGNLEVVLRDYLNRCRDANGNIPPGSAAEKLAGYLPRVTTRDETLRNDAGFHAALKEAAQDPRMEQAQDSAFERAYLAPAEAAITKDGLASPMALALYADTAIQCGENGLEKIREQTKNQWGDKPPPATPVEEKEYLKLFLEQRAVYLRGRADKKEAKKDLKTADMLRNSAKVRVEGHLMKLLENEDLELTGGEDRVLKMGGKSIPGVGRAPAPYCGFRC